MKGLVMGWGIAALLAILVKLFTYEFFLQDDPTTGIALRFPPALASHQVLVESPLGADPILLQDENAFVGSTVYRALVNWGWIVLHHCLAHVAGDRLSLAPRTTQGDRRPCQITSGSLS